MNGGGRSLKEKMKKFLTAAGKEGKIDARLKRRTTAAG
jgi:hypothetical protein